MEEQQIVEPAVGEEAVVVAVVVVVVAVDLKTDLVHCSRVEAAFQEDNLDIGNLAEGIYVVEVDEIQQVHQKEEEDIDNCHTLAAEADTDALEGSLENVVTVAEEQWSIYQHMS